MGAARELNDRSLKLQLGEAKRFLAFAGVGAVGVATNFGLYTLLIHVGLHYLAASWISWAIAFVLTFAINVRVVFDFRGRTGPAFMRSLVVYSGQQIAMTIMLFAGVDLLGLHETLAFVLALPPAVAISYLGLKLYAFGARES